MSIKNKIVFITGGASGLGRVIVSKFIEEGAKVCFTYRNSEENAMLLQQQYGESIYSVKADASDYLQAIEAVNKCIEHFGGLDILVNNAASAKDSSLKNLDMANFSYTINNVLYPVVNYSKAVCDHFIKQCFGKIINIGSINGMRGREGSLAYSTAKAGIEGFTKTIAKELGQYNINCNIVAPGYIDTDGQKNTSELIKKLVLDECPIRRLTKPEEVANLVIFLAGDMANNITGQVYQIDCGQYI
ncbi:SDR family oxidoreductase [Anaerosporobacter sp.]|uniref:SDR family oxidoreductase n=1 Tax=Anaerosporobacter sp. TaxID=1872529 RepID=UPI00286F87D0|nr:SDR family oxidoreductase [Anaerosporobacter sp.]